MAGWYDELRKNRFRQERDPEVILKIALQREIQVKRKPKQKHNPNKAHNLFLNIWGDENGCFKGKNC